MRTPLLNPKDGSLTQLQANYFNGLATPTRRIDILRWIQIHQAVR